MKRVDWVAFAVSFAVGALVMVGMNQRHNWWLDSAAGVSGVAVSLLVAAAVLALWRPVPRWEPSLALDAGATNASMVLLLLQGPGTIWPIVIAVGFILTTVAIAAGTALGTAAHYTVAALGRLLRRRAA